jgi:hypothetical protein
MRCVAALNGGLFPSLRPSAGPASYLRAAEQREKIQDQSFKIQHCICRGGGLVFCASWAVGATTNAYYRRRSRRHRVGSSQNLSPVAKP